MWSPTEPERSLEGPHCKAPFGNSAEKRLPEIGSKGRTGVRVGVGTTGSKAGRERETGVWPRVNAALPWKGEHDGLESQVISPGGSFSSGHTGSEDALFS